MKAPLLAGHGHIIGGSVWYPNWAGGSNSGWYLWYHGIENTTQNPRTPVGLAQKNKSVMVLDSDNSNGSGIEVSTGSLLEMAPGNYESPTSDADGVILQNANYACEKDDCPFGTFIVCLGKEEACASREGQRTGGMLLSTEMLNDNGTPYDDDWPNLMCLVE